MRDIYVLDLHTHTYASGHAYNTMNEMAYAAKEKGLQLLGITDHAPAMPYSSGPLHFLNLKVARREKYGLPLLLGVEANIVDYEVKPGYGGSGFEADGYCDRKSAHSVY